MAEKIWFVEETLQPGMSVSFVARRHGLSPSLLFNWRRRMAEGGREPVRVDDEVIGAGGSVSYSNNLEKIETICDDGRVEGADPTIAALTGRIDVRLADTTLIDLAADGTPVDLEFAYTLFPLARLMLTARCACASPSSRSGGGVQASFDFRGAKNTAAGLTVTLTNDLDGTVYV